MLVLLGACRLQLHVQLPTGRDKESHTKFGVHVVCVRAFPSSFGSSLNTLEQKANLPAQNSFLLR